EHSRSERQIQSSTGINVFEWPFDSNIRKCARRNGMRMLESDHSHHRTFPFRTHIFRTFTCAILRWTRFICVKESLTLDSPRKLDSNHVDSEVIWGSSERVERNQFPAGDNGMARAHAANACAQSDSIKGLAQSIAKPAYHRLLTAEPALRRAVPTLIIAFLITICLGAFVQVLDQSRQKRKANERDLAALSDYLAERLDRLASIRHERPTSFERLQLLMADLIPSWGRANGRHVIIAGADRRILARIPTDSGL